MSDSLALPGDGGDAVEEPGRVPVKSIENDMTAMEPFMVSFSTCRKTYVGRAC